MPQMKEITSGLRFPEGPVAMNDGSVLVVEIARSTLTRVRPNGAKEVIPKPAAGLTAQLLGRTGMSTFAIMAV